tara:strand:+ start:60 stop:287 length:228 start_codon:yes stop_codon:yes gene_type:complete
MKITNSEYDFILIGLTNLKRRLSESNSKAVKNLIDRLEKEYNRLAHKNMEEGMTSAEEEIYPSRLNTNYGEPIGR